MSFISEWALQVPLQGQSTFYSVKVIFNRNVLLPHMHRLVRSLIVRKLMRFFQTFCCIATKGCNTCLIIWTSALLWIITLAGTICYSGVNVSSWIMTYGELIHLVAHNQTNILSGCLCSLLSSYHTRQTSHLSNSLCPNDHFSTVLRLILFHTDLRKTGITWPFIYTVHGGESKKEVV